MLASKANKQNFGSDKNACKKLGEGVFECGFELIKSVVFCVFVVNTVEITDRCTLEFDKMASFF